MGERSTGLIIVAVGVAVVLLGLLWMTGALNWFGRLPGDIRYDSGRTRVYAPIVSMLLLSLVISLVMYLLRRFF